MKRTVIAITLILVLLLANAALAMSSANYALNWFIPLSSGGGQPSSSAHYEANCTIGQTSIGQANSAHYGVNLGFWQALYQQLAVYLPLIRK